MDRVSRNKLVETTQSFFKDTFGYQPNYTSSAPGRINIIGEHTDYNLGVAMPAGIDRWICVSISIRKDKKIHVYSKNYEKNLQYSLSSKKSGNFLWEKYVIGLISVVQENYKIKFGFNMLIYGNVPIGLGVSSSAALEVAILGSISALFRLSLSSTKFLQICSRVDNEYVGVKSGLLDQYVSLLSKKQGPMIIDFSKLDHEIIDCSIDNCEFVLINSTVDRSLLQSEYNKRVEQCNKGLELINMKMNYSKKINEINHTDLDCLDRHSLYFSRLHHLITENQRVYEMHLAIKEKDLYKMGSILNQSHISLSKDYEVSCSKIESIIQVSSQAPGFYGSRIMGGGFGGCTLSIVSSNRLEEFTSFIKKFKIKPIRVKFSSGLKLH